MQCHIYLDRKTGKVLVPRTVETEAGYWLDVEPVEQASVDDPLAISAIVKKTMEYKHPVVPTPSRSTFPKPVVLAHSAARSWRDFERRNAQFTILRTAEGQFQIERYRKEQEGVGAVVDKAAGKSFAPKTRIDEVVRELLCMMRSEC